jgi:hypothetical protein
VRDPLFARCLYLEDSQGSSLAIVCLDLASVDFEAANELRKEIREKTGTNHALINFSHSHASVPLGPRGRTRIANDTGSQWNDQTLDAIVAMVKKAKGRAGPASLRAGRAAAQVGFNRRLVNKETGAVEMNVNRDGPVVPWVNVLVADSSETHKPVAVLFEHAAHPVIAPTATQLISADYPGAAAKRIRQVLGDGAIALFAQGCGGNINGFPLRSTHEQADQAGRRLGDAAIEAIAASEPIKSQAFRVKYAEAMLPSAPLPSEEEWKTMAEQNKADPRRMEQLNRIRGLLDRGEKPPPRRLAACAVMFGSEWCLVAMSGEMFCQYELWVDKNAPFKRSMTFGYTGGGSGYIAMDEDLRMGAKGGYEAARLPNWCGQVWGPCIGPPAVGCEKIVKDTLASLWADGEKKGQKRCRERTS